MELSDFIASYPPPFHESGNQTLITEKEEFRQLALSAQEPPHLPGDPFLHQIFAQRWMRMNDRALVIDEPGTGKSRLIYEVAEHYRENPGELKRVYWLVKNRTLISEAQRQILCAKGNRADNFYLTKAIVGSTDETSRKAQITRSVSRWYTIETYVTFSHRIINRRQEGVPIADMSDAELIREFDHSLFIVDEVHSLVNHSHFDRSDTDETLGKALGVFHRLFHVVPHLKVILASASPMIDSVQAIVPILNLLLPLNNQLPTDFTDAELRSRIHGLVCFVKTADTGVNLVYHGEPLARDDINLSKTIIKSSDMGDLQLEAYGTARGDRDVDADLEEHAGSGGSVAHQAERQASSFAFPNGKADTASFRRYVNFNSASNRYFATSELLPFLKGEELRRISSKTYDMITDLKSSQGVAFAYCPYVKAGGIILHGLAIEANGFALFNETKPVFAESRRGIAPLCGASEEMVERTGTIRKAPRYAIISGETTDAQRDIIMSVLRSYENRYGEYIRILLGSQITRDGINLPHVTRFYNLSYEWNISSNWQAMYRIIRSTSHDVLLRELREREGPDKRIDIHIFQLVNSDIDRNIYRTGIDKDLKIRKVMRILKESAVDAWINRDRNQMPPQIEVIDSKGQRRNLGTDYSMFCDYSPCKFDPIEPYPAQIDYTTFDFYYSEPLIEALIASIGEYLSLYSQLRIDYLYKILEGGVIRRKQVNQAISRLVGERRPLFDRVGYLSFAREQGDHLFLTRDYPGYGDQVQYDWIDGYYAGAATVVRREALSEIVVETKPAVVESLADMKKISFAQRVLRVEEAIDHLQAAYCRNEPANQLDSEIYQEYQELIFKFPYPTSYLAYFDQLVRTEPLHPGRKATGEARAEQLRELARVALQTLQRGAHPIEEGDCIIVHGLDILNEQNVDYRLTTNIRNVVGKLRKWERQEGAQGFGVWHDVIENEMPAYQTLIKEFFNLRFRELEKFPFHGLQIGSGFRIVRNRTTLARGKKYDPRGINCTSILKGALIEILWDLNVVLPAEEALPSRDNMLVLLQRETGDKIDQLKQADDELIKFFYRWALYDKNVLCGYISKIMHQREMVFEVARNVHTK